jgi:hypothetical protein
MAFSVCGGCSTVNKSAAWHSKCQKIIICVATLEGERERMGLVIQRHAKPLSRRACLERQMNYVYVEMGYRSR